MAALFSTSLRNKLLGGYSLGDALAGGFIHVYSCALGDIPASADAAIDSQKHTKLLTVYGDGTSAGLNFGTASGGAIGKDPGESWGGTVLASGNATFFRFVGVSDTGGVSDGTGWAASATSGEPRIQGRVGGAGAELYLPALSLTQGETQSINFISIGIPG